MNNENIQHPDMEWAKSIVRDAKQHHPSGVSEEDLDTMVWNSLMGCYLMQWCGMTLGIEKDGHMRRSYAKVNWDTTHKEDE